MMALLSLLSRSKPWRPLAAGIALAAALLPVASAQTYTSASTAFAFIDPTSHAKLGANTTPYKLRTSAGCATTVPVTDDTLSDPLPIGFTFKFGTTNYTTVYVMTNGRLQFGNTTCGAGTASIGPPQTYPYSYPDASMNNTMKVFGVDLDPTNLVDRPNYPSSTNKTPCASINTCYIAYATLGTAPARQFVVTWKNVPEWVNSTNTSGAFDLQVILNEDGTFVFQYGNNISHGGTGTAQVGWQLTSTDYQRLTFGASVEPSANSAIKFFLPGPIASYYFDEGAWLPGVSDQVRDATTAARHGTALGDAQTATNGKVCRAADIPRNANVGDVNAVRTGLNLGDSTLNLQGTATVAFWYRANSAWTANEAAQLMDATAVNGEWFFLTRTASGALLFEIKDSTGVIRTVTTPAQAFPANTWVHIAVTWNFNGLAGSNQDQMQVFINAGTPTTSSFTTSGSITNQAGFLHFGDNFIGVTDTTGTLNSANGQFDEVQVFNYVLTQAQVNTVMNSTHGCPTYVIDHLEIQHSSGNGLTCTPSTLTVRACANAACTSLYTSGVSGQFTSTGTPTVNWDGTSGNGSGSRFVIGLGSSSVTKNFQMTTVGSATIGATVISPSVLAATTCNFGSPSCTFSSADSGFVLQTPNHTAEQSQTLTVRAVRKADNSLACTPAFANVSKPVTLTCGYANPTSGTLPVRVGGTPLATSATSACSAAGASVNLAFDATGQATTTLQYADVGQVNLNARYAPTSGLEAGLVMLGSTSFVAKPAGFVLSGIQCSSAGAPGCAVTSPGVANPAATSATGPAFIGAGRDFSVTVTARNSAGATTPNYGRETPAEGVRLTHALVQPASGGATGTLANPTGFGSFTAGVATGTTFNWSEVGIITLTPSVADADYLGTGDVTGTVSGNVGRFVPAGFALSNPVITHRVAAACSPASTFTYLDENFQLGFTLTAQNASGGTTTNYEGSFAKLALGTPTVFGLAGIQGTTLFKTGGRLNLTSSSGTWSKGVAASTTLVANVARAASPDGPFATAQFGLAATDTDGVGMRTLNLDTDSPANGADATLVGTIPLRHGRLRLQNAIGAANRALSLPLAAQYWNGSAFTTNDLDSCTRITSAHLSFGNLRKTLTTADLAMSPSSVTVHPTQPRFITLAAPGGSRIGSVDVAVALDAGAPPTDWSCLKTVNAWAPSITATNGANFRGLRGAWCGSTFTSDPSARATWGLNRGADGILFQRENY